MRILVTGASGLVGRHILSRLSAEKTIFLIAQSQSRPLINWHGQNISLTQLGLDSKDAEDILVAAAPNIIVHCAAKIPTPAASAEQAAEVNGRIDAVVSNVANRCGAQVIFISSVIVYEGIDCPWVEDDVVNPFNSYARQKYESEVLFSRLGIAAASLRISSPYGGRQNAQRNVLYKFIHAALGGEKLKIYGEGSRRQDFIYAPDIAEAVWSIVSARLAGKEVGGIFNIASGSPVSMRELAELIIDIVGSGVVASSGEEDPQEGFDPRIDICKAREVFGWKPNTTLASGIRNIVASLRSQDADRFCF
jgi:nucleoside-diphosphate-sugar epimerase